MSAAKQYLGDSVYADIDHGMIKLTTEDGIRATNTIFLDPDVIDELLRYLKNRVISGVRS